MEKQQNLTNQKGHIEKNNDALFEAFMEGRITVRAGNDGQVSINEISENDIRVFLSEVVKERNKYAGLFKHAPAGYVILNETYKIVEVNAAGRNLLKKSEKEILEKTFTDFVDADYVESFQFYLKNLKAGKTEENCRLKFNNGSGFFILKGKAFFEEISESQTYNILFFEDFVDQDEKPGITNFIEQTEAKPQDKQVVAEEILDKLTVLVVDDDDIARIYLAELLKGKCKELLFATNGKEAVEVIQGNKAVDLVLMDIRMPVMDGYTATIKIKGINKKVVIIAQTAYALASDREKALAAGCNDYLAKPLLKKDLFSVIQKFF